MASQKPDDMYVMVAAIDFGTTFSGYAFSFKSSPASVSMNKNWGEVLGFQSYKTPTSVLIRSDGTFVAFGHEAENKYGQFVESADRSNEAFQMYRHFKMLLHKEKNLSHSTKLVSVSGKIIQAMDIFVMSLKYLKDHLISSLAKQVKSPPSADMIRWVLTVPAIWTEEAKQFMREAAYKAGCINTKNSRKLVIALEPEAASLFCRSLDIDGFAQHPEGETVTFKTNTKYLVIDAGGGTVDITAHKMCLSGDIEELHVANGGSWGGIEVDNNFANLLKEILGADFVNSFKQNYPVQWLTMMGAFEKAKKGINPNDDTTQIIIPLVWSLGIDYNKKTKKNVESVINSNCNKGVSFKHGSIFLTHSASIQLFEKVVENVAQHVKELIRQPKLHDITHVLVVGGFGECVVLQQAIEKILPKSMTMLVPYEAQLSVIKGAVSFGHNTAVIRSRIAKKTYGTNVLKHFQESKHDPRQKKIMGGDVAWCEDIFETFITAGDSIQVSDVITKERTPVYDAQSNMRIQIYSSERSHFDEVEYTDGPGIEKIGSVKVQMPNKEKNLDRIVKLEFRFGGTEIQVRATDVESGSTAETVIDFIAD